MKRRILPVFFFFTVVLLWSQSSAAEHLSYIGMTLTEVIENLGVPETVATARGAEIWQDDVVFQYPAVELYIYRDRVWQIKPASSHGISNRDSKTVVLLTLGDTAQDFGDYILMPITGRNWPLILRVNFNDAGQVTAIYIYRPDY